MANENLFFVDIVLLKIVINRDMFMLPWRVLMGLHD